MVNGTTGESGRFKTSKIDGQNEIKWTKTKVGGPQKSNWTVLKSALVVKKGWKWTVPICVGNKKGIKVDGYRFRRLFNIDESERTLNVGDSKGMKVDSPNRLKMDGPN